MPIVIRLVKQSHKGGPDIWTPMIMCDVCGKDVSDGRAGGFAYAMDGEEDASPRYACKGACLDEVMAKLRWSGGIPGWHELYAFVGWLKGNVMRGSTDDSRRLADEFEDGGGTW